LEYEDKPDYNMLTGLFERCMKRRGVRENDPYDWEKPIESVQPPVTVSIVTNNTAPVISKPNTCTSYGINNQLVTSTGDNEQDKKISPEVLNIFNF